jgi:DNA-binding transcriptional MerR regulator
VSDTTTGSVAGSDRAAQERARARAGQQGLLFTDDLPQLPEDMGYRGPTACSAAGITYRQLDYWARTGLVEPGIRGAAGSGSQRLYSFRDILVLKVVKRLLDTGVSLQNIRTAVAHLRERVAAPPGQGRPCCPSSWCRSRRPPSHTPADHTVGTT